METTSTTITKEPRKRKPKTTQEQIDLICEMYRKTPEISVNSVERITGINRGVVMRIKKENGIGFDKSFKEKYDEVRLLIDSTWDFLNSEIMQRIDTMNDKSVASDLKNKLLVLNDPLKKFGILLEYATITRNTKPIESETVNAKVTLVS